MLMPADPLAGGIADYRKRLRAGSTSIEATVIAYLARIAALNGSLYAYLHVAHASALARARDLDRMLAAGKDLGPLMGVPVAIKDIITVDGMPTTGGSRLDISDRIGAEGDFVKRLRAAGCVILGKLSTCEFAIGSAGCNYLLGTPRNPWDSELFRVCGGSSSGSAAAMAAGLCGFSVGTDTGGSVRTPASFCGVFGMKPSTGIWSTDGVLPMSRTLDSIGFMTRSATDAAEVWATMSAQPAEENVSLSGLRLGRPGNFFRNLDLSVAATLDHAFAKLEESGARFVDFTLAELDECGDLFLSISRTELMAELGPQWYMDTRARMNPDVAMRIESGLHTSGVDYIQSLARRRQLYDSAKSLFGDFDIWLGPTKQHIAPPFPGTFSLADDEAMNKLCAGPTRAANIMGLCAASQALVPRGTHMPIGLQLMAPRDADGKLLAAARAIEKILGRGAQADMNGFL